MVVFSALPTAARLSSLQGGPRYGCLGRPKGGKAGENRPLTRLRRFVIAYHAFVPTT